MAAASGLNLKYAPVGYDGLKGEYCADIYSPKFLDAVRRENTSRFKLMWVGIFTDVYNAVTCVLTVVIALLIVLIGLYGPTLVVTNGPVVSNEVVVGMPSVEVSTNLPVAAQPAFQAPPGAAFAAALPALQSATAALTTPPVVGNIAASVPAESLMCGRWIVNSCSGNKWADAKGLRGFPPGFSYALAADCDARCVASPSTLSAFTGVCECTKLPNTFVSV